MRSLSDRFFHPTPTGTMSNLSVAPHRSVLYMALAAAFVIGAAAASTPRVRTAAPTQPVAALDDPTIVAIFDAANTWDIETGALAEKKGTTKDIRDFGAMLVH